MKYLISRLPLAFGLLLGALMQAQPVQTDLNDLLLRYREARAETAVYLDTRSVGSRGEITQGDQQLSYELFQRENGQIRYELKHPGKPSIIQVYDGDAGWVWIAENPDVGVRKLEDKQLRFFRLNCGFRSPLDEPERFDFAMKYEGLNRGQSGALEHYIRLESANYGDVLDVWIDAYTFLENRREYRPTQGETPLVTVFSDYQKVDGLMIPHLVTTTFQGETLSRTVVKQTSRNTGMLSFFFAKPRGYAVVEDEVDDES